MAALELQKMWDHSHQHRPLSSSTRMQRSRIIPHLPPCKSSGTVVMDQQTPDNLLPSSEFFMCSNSWSPLRLKGAPQCFGVWQAFCLALKCCLPLFDAPLLLFISKNAFKIAVNWNFLLFTCWVEWLFQNTLSACPSPHCSLRTIFLETTFFLGWLCLVVPLSGNKLLPDGLWKLLLQNTNINQAPALMFCIAAACLPHPTRTTRA